MAHRQKLFNHQARIIARHPIRFIELEDRNMWRNHHLARIQSLCAKTMQARRPHFHGNYYRRSAAHNCNRFIVWIQVP